MSRTVYVNGDYIAEERATISVFDRGFLFADGIYEVTSVLDGKLMDFQGHMARLSRSLKALNIPEPEAGDTLLDIHRELVERNAVEQGLVYLQITRGTADRDFGWSEGMEPSLVLFTQSRELIENPLAKRGVKIISQPDLRWARRDIKTVQLLYPAMAKMAAQAAGAGDAWLVEDDLVTEGTSNNAWIVTADGTLITRGLSSEILHGITRAAVMRMAREAQMKIEERPFSIKEAQEAREAFNTSASAFVMPVVEIDGVALGDGSPGPVAKRLREIYIEEMRKSAV